MSVPQLPLKFSKLTGGSNGLRTAHDADEHLALRASAGLRRRSRFVAAWLLLRGRIGRAFRAIRDSEVAAASSGVSLPIYKTLAFGVSAAFAGVAGSLFVLVTNGFAQPNEFGVAALAPAPDRRGRGRPRLALGRRSSAPLFIGLLPEISASVPLDRVDARPGRRLRPDRDPVMLLLPNGFAGLLRAL